MTNQIRRTKNEGRNKTQTSRTILKPLGIVAFFIDIIKFSVLLARFSPQRRRGAESLSKVSLRAREGAYKNHRSDRQIACVVGNLSAPRRLCVENFFGCVEPAL
jgi:hypothetical protein